MERPSGRPRSLWENAVRMLRSRRAIVEDSSMEPEFLPGDRLRFAPPDPNRAPLGVGDIVVLSDPDRSGRLLLKEVAATAGSAVSVTRSGVVVTREPTSATKEEAIELVRVPPGHVYVVSRRPAGARDSRTFGPIPVSLVLGRVWYRYAPNARRGPVGARPPEGPPPKH
ncbi:MAG: signal peptidase I [Thermoplasmata archaeon]|nr:signal peptidase I [Thermoplasmata archaeon]